MKKHPWVTAIVIATTVVIVVIAMWVHEGPLWRLIHLERHWTESPDGRQHVFHVKPDRTRAPFWVHLHGLWTTYYPGGRIAEQGYYRDDRREGFWTKWNEDGRVRSQALFLRGRVVEVHRAPPWSSGVEDQDPPAELPVAGSRGEK